MFAAQVEALKGRYRCLTYDHRGQGQSEVTRDGYDIETLYRDAVELIEKIGSPPVHFVGLSMGGFVGMRLAARRHDLLRSLILMETSADTEPEKNIPRYRMLNLIARWIGFGPVTGPVMKIMFGRKLLNDPARIDVRREMERQLRANDRIGITRAVTGVIERKGVYEELDRISCPTLILVGDQDVATTPDRSERIHARISGSKLVMIPGAGHTSSVEEPEFVNAALQEFLKGVR
jgi:pimeloyl-ACP methyl ester carboxylesterase